MVAVDLLGKMHAGSDKTGGSGPRFKDVVKILLPVENHGSNIGEQIYAFNVIIILTRWRLNGSLTVKM